MKKTKNEGLKTRFKNWTRFNLSAISCESRRENMQARWLNVCLMHVYTEVHSVWTAPYAKTF